MTDISLPPNNKYTEEWAEAWLEKFDRDWPTVNRRHHIVLRVGWVVLFVGIVLQDVRAMVAALALSGVMIAYACLWLARLMWFRRCCIKGGIW